jgi:hypothetical protein
LLLLNEIPFFGRSGGASGGIFGNNRTTLSDCFLALAVCEDNLAGLEKFAAAPEVTLDDILARVIDQLTTLIAFVAMLDPSTADPRLSYMSDRLRGVLATELDAARTGGALRDDVTAEDLMLALALLARTDAAARPAGLGTAAARPATVGRQGFTRRRSIWL